MLNTPDSRASRRAHEAASAHSAVRAKRPLLIVGTIAGLLLGASVTVGAVTAPALASGPSDVGDTQGKASTAALLKIPDEITQATTAAQEAAAGADALSAEVAASGLDLGTSAPAVDTAELHDDIEELADRASTPPLELSLLTVTAQQRTTEVVAETAELQTAFAAAQEAKAAADAAAAQAAEEQRQAAAAAALAAANTPEGAKATAREMAASRYGWGEDQFSCLVSLWNKESGWNYKAYNPSGATGIPQALPGSKMAAAGSDWQTNASTQVAWGLGYIDSVYGTPCSAWGHSQATNWY